MACPPHGTGMGSVLAHAAKPPLLPASSPYEMSWEQGSCCGTEGGNFHPEIL